MTSSFTLKYLDFNKDKKAQKSVLMSLMKLTKDIKHAEDLMIETLDDLIIKDADSPIEATNFAGLLKVSARNRWLKQIERSKKIDKRQRDIQIVFYDDFNEEKALQLKNTEIVASNCNWIVRNLRVFIPNDFERRIFLDHYFDGIKYTQIAAELKNEGVRNKSGELYTSGNLRIKNHRISNKLKRQINLKFPFFSTQKIANDGI